MGKAHEVYSTLSVEQGANYEVVKREILKAYELIPEAYCQQFREMKCKEGQVYMEFACQKEVLFNRWCTSQQIGDSFERLKQLILLEEFKRCVPATIKTYLEEQKVSELQKAATLADDYKLTHQSLNSASDTKNTNPTKLKGTSNSAHPPITDKNANQPRDQEQSLHKGGMSLRPGPICAYCKRRGHLFSECYTLVTTTDHSAGEVVLKTPDTFKPFISQGYISIDKNHSESVPISILHDTGASQSLLAEGILPLSELSATGRVF